MLRNLRRFSVLLVTLAMLATPLLNAAPALAQDAPGNDNFASPTLVGSLPFTDTIDTSGATQLDANDPQPGCDSAPYGTYYSVWYAYTPSVTTPIDANTFGSTALSGGPLDTVLSVWTGSPGALTAVTCNDESSNVSSESEVQFTPQAGTTYYFMVAGFDDASFGSLTFNVNLAGAGRLGFIPPDPQVLYDGTVSGVITVQLQDNGTPYGIPPAAPGPVTAVSDVVVTLTSNSTGGTFYSDAAGTNAITSVTIPAGANSASFYYMDTVQGSWFMTASASGLTEGYLNFTVQPPPAAETVTTASDVTVSYSPYSELVPLSATVTLKTTGAPVTEGRVGFMLLSGE